MRTKLAIILIALILLPIQAAASLTFPTNGDRVDIGNTGTDPTSFTMYAWVKVNTFSGGTRFFAKINASSLTGYEVFGLAGSNELRTDVDYSTTDASAISSEANFILTGTWYFVAATFDGTNAPKIYKGTLTSRVNETASYSTQVAPVGSRVTDGGGSALIGNQNSTGVYTSKCGCDIAVINWMPGVVLNLGQLRSHQFAPHPEPETRYFDWLGMTGTGTQPDLSGHKNNGIVTASGVTPNVPIGAPFAFAASESKGDLAMSPLDYLLALRDNVFSFIKRFV